MPEDPPANDPTPATPTPPGGEFPRAGSTPKGLSPELRKFLGTPKGLQARAEAETAKEERPEAAAPRRSSADVPRPQSSRRPRPEQAGPREEEPAPPARPSWSTKQPVSVDHTAIRRAEVRRAVIIIGALLLLGMVFYVGRKFEYLKYRMLAARHDKTTQAANDQFPGVSAEELVEQAVTAERAGDYNEAARRLLAAKQKDIRYRGIFFRVGKMAFDHGDVDTADHLFERAIAFGENLDSANYYRGFVAMKRNDFPAAQRFFREAAAAGPFEADYPYHLAEALRMDHHPNDAVQFYNKAAHLGGSALDEAVCDFKARMARIEAGDLSKVGEEVDAHKDGGRIAPGWLLTAAALAIRDGRPADAIPLITEAKRVNAPDIYAVCINDFFFKQAAEKDTMLANTYGGDIAPDGPAGVSKRRRGQIARKPLQPQRQP
jgi:tetratricopeptide (TPR) repeat protein